MVESDPPSKSLDTRIKSCNAAAVKQRLTGTLTGSQELGRVTLGAHQQEGGADRPPVAGGGAGAWYCSIYRNDFNHLAEDQSGGSERLHLSLAPPPFGHLGVFDDSNISRCLLSWIRHQKGTKICLLEKINLIHLSEVPQRTTVAPPCGRRPGADEASPNNWTPLPTPDQLAPS